MQESHLFAIVGWAFDPNNDKQDGLGRRLVDRLRLWRLLRLAAFLRAPPDVHHVPQPRCAKPVFIVDLAC